MNRTSIGRLRLCLHTQERQAELLQNRASAWFHARLQHELGTLLTQYAGPDLTTRSIDRLTVAVGDIPLSRFETEMSSRVLDQLSQQLRAYGWPKEHLALSLQEQESQAVESADLAAISRSQDPLAAFIQLLQYLDTGVVADARPWAGRYARDAWLVTVLESASLSSVLVEEMPMQVALALRVLQPRARQRLITTWPTLAAKRVSQWLMAPTQWPMSATSEGTRFLPLAALIALQRHPEAASRYERLLPAVESPTLQQRVLLAEQMSATGGATSSTVAGDGFSFEQAELNASNSATSPDERDTHDATWGDRGAVASEHALETWLDQLLRTPLSALLRMHLQAWLLDPGLVNLMLPRLGRLRVPVRQRLRAVLGLPMQQPSSLLELQSRKGAAEQSDAPEGTAFQAEVWRGRDQELSAARTKAMLEEQNCPPHLQVVGERDEPWVVASAGLVLLWPLLPRLFGDFGWLEEGRFIDQQARWQAVGCLDWLAWGDRDAELAEWRAPCLRLLCGIPWEEPFEVCAPTLERQAELDQWLERNFAALPLLERCSVNDLRGFFLQRAGALVVGERVMLTVESDATDILLQGLPWPLTQVLLPWLPTPIGVDWIS